MANTAVFGIYASRSQVENAVEELRAAGFRNTDISVLFPDNVGTREFAHEKDTKVPEGVTTGATSGAGGVLGGLAGALIGMGIPEYEAKRYEGRIHRGNILLSVHSDDSNWAQKAKAILEDTGAEDIAASAEAKADYPGVRR